MKTNFDRLAIPLPVLFPLAYGTNCMKSEEVPPEQPKSIFDVKANAAFNWKTVKEMTLEVKGMQVPVTITNTMVVKSVDGKSIYFNDQVVMNADRSIRFAIPAHIRQVTVTYGTITKTT